MAFSSLKLALIGISLAVSNTALALGLGNVSGQPVLGQPLLLEIPLLGTDEGIPALECFKVRPPAAEIESGFVLRNAQIQIQNERNQARLVLTSASAVREPVLEFGLAVGCGFGLSKDYLLLTAEPLKIALPTQPTAPVIPTVSSEPTVAKTDALEPRKPESSTSSTLRLVADVTLEQLARQRYPLQPKAREKFIRMMMQANPDIEKADNLITADAELQIPPGLPVQRRNANRPESKTVAVPKPSAVQPAAEPRVVAAVAKPVKPNRDILVLGHSGQRSAAELLSEAERLTALLAEQTNAQMAAADKLTQLEDSYKALQKRAGLLENRINAIEAERQAEKLAPKPASFDFLELLLAVLVGGALGGLSLYFYTRFQFRRESRLSKASEEDSNKRLGSGLASVALNDRDAGGLPWQQGQPTARQPSANAAGGGNGSLAENSAPQPKAAESALQPASPQNDFDFVSKS